MAAPTESDLPSRPHPLNLDQPSPEDRAAFATFSRQRTRDNTQVVALTLVSTVVAFWPLDRLVLRDEAWRAAVGRTRLGELALLCTLYALVRWTRLGERWPAAMLLLGCVGAALGLVAGIGTVDAPHHRMLYCLYVAAFVCVFYVGPLPRRVAGIAVVFVATVLGLLWLQPDIAHAAMFPNFLVMLFFACLCAIGAGHVVYRPTRESFLRGRALARLNVELDGRVAERTAELRALSAHLSSAVEEERKRIARDIHDELGQTLAALRCEVELLELLRLGPAEEPAARMHQLLDSAMGTSRRILGQLRPLVLDEFGLAAGLSWLRDDLHRRAPDLDCALLIDLPARPPDQEPDLAERERDTALFRIVQECLNNVQRHARARRVTVELRSSPQTLRLSVTDDGCGLDAGPRRPGAMGLLGMRERARQLDGCFQVGPGPEGGTRVEVELPAGPDGRAP